MTIGKHTAHAIATMETKATGKGCSKCGSTGLHACTGQPIEPWTPEKIEELKRVLSKYEA